MFTGSSELRKLFDRQAAWLTRPPLPRFARQRLQTWKGAAVFTDWGGIVRVSFLAPLGFALTGYSWFRLCGSGGAWEISTGKFPACCSITSIFGHCRVAPINTKNVQRWPPSLIGIIEGRIRVYLFTMVGNRKVRRMSELAKSDRIDPDKRRWQAQSMFPVCRRC